MCHLTHVEGQRHVFWLASNHKEVVHNVPWETNRAPAALIAQRFVLKVVYVFVSVLSYQPPPPPPFNDL